MKKIIFLGLLAVSNLVDAQVGNENVSFSTINFFMRGNRPTTKEYSIDGEPYIDGNKFTKVNIKGFSKNVQDLRYNAFDDEMEFQQDGQIYFANKEANLDIHFSQLAKTYKCLNYSLEGKEKLGYLVTLVDGKKFFLYKREKIELLKGEKSTNAYSKDANDYYAKAKDLYLITKGTVMYKFPKNVKDLEEITGTKNKNIEVFAKNNKINFNKESDLIKLVEFMNEQ